MSPKAPIFHLPARDWGGGGVTVEDTQIGGSREVKKM